MKINPDTPNQPNLNGVELPTDLYLKILEIALKTGKSEEQVLGGLMESVLDLMDSPGETELKGFAVEAREALRRTR